MMLYKSSLKEARTEFKYWLTPDNELLEVHVSETHEGFLYDYTGEDYSYHDALEDGWIRIIGISHILYFNCRDYDNKKFKRIYNVLQRNFKLTSYTSDIEVVDDRYNKRYQYYGSKMKPVLSEKKVNKLIVYHGSNTKDIKKFDTETSFGGDYGAGAYFTEDKDRAKEHGKFLYTCELTLKKPYEVKDKYEMNSIFDSLMGMQESGDIPETMDMRSYIISVGFDGIIVKNPNLGGYEDTKSPYYIAYHSNQIKILSVEGIK